MPKQKMPKEEKSSFSHFFREDAKLVADVLNEEERHKVEDAIFQPEKLPFIENVKAFPDDRLKDEWRKLRTFFRQGSGQVLLPDGFKPAILGPSLSKDLTAGDFPVWVATVPGSLGPCLPLNEILSKAFNNLGLDKKTSILVKNLDRIVNLTAIFLKEKGPGEIQTVLKKVLSQLDAQIDVGGNEGEVFKKELKTLQNTLPDQGMLFPFGPEASYQLLNAAIAHSSMEARKDLDNEILVLRSKLNDILQVESAKSPSSHDPAKLHDALGFVDAIVKFDELASLVPKEGSEPMDISRTNRIADVVSRLEEADVLLDFRASLFIDASLHENEELLWQKLFEKVEINFLSETDGLNHLSTLFEERIAPYEHLFKAKRIAELELENKYQAEIHDDYFSNFSWLNFSERELQQSTYFILVVDDVHLFGADFAGLSEILANNFPLKIVAIKKHDSLGHSLDQAGNVPVLHSQVELGALMMSYKNIYVAQSSPINPHALFSQLKEGLDAFAPAFLYILDVSLEPGYDPYLHTSAAIESRDFPSFTFRGLLGTPWGSRFDLTPNPHPDAAWPMHKMEIMVNGEDHTLDLPFTFAEWASLNPLYHQHYLPVPAQAWTEELIPLDEYLQLSAVDSIGKVPFIWMIDAENQLHKVAVSWPVVIATQERLDFWHFLQENSGINNYHVAAAVKKLKSAMAQEYEAELERIKKEHKDELDRTRKEEAGRAMENLASILLDLNDSGLSLSSTPKPVAIEKKEVSNSEASSVEVLEKKMPDQPVEDDTLIMEPYIDTPLCTSCNECINRNKAMFRYNQDKMAYIADATAGTFQQLVEAAEICPVAIIHPGTPLNPHEPDLKHLIERAAKFN